MIQIQLNRGYGEDHIDAKSRMRISVSKRVIFCTLFALSSVASAEVYKGVVTGVIDGDTLTVLVNQEKEYTVRLAGIDAPELSQSYGKEVRDVLDKRLNGNFVLIKSEEILESEGQIIGMVALNGYDTGLWLLESGFAWIYESYGVSIPTDWEYAYKLAVADAHSSRQGLWIYSGAVPPWSWRKQQREAHKAEKEKARESLDGISLDLAKDWSELERFNRGESGKNKDSIEDRTLISTPENISLWEMICRFSETVSRWLKVYLSNWFKT